MAYTGGSLIAAEPAKEGASTYLISDMQSDIKDGSLTLLIAGNTAPAYTEYERFNPYRLVLDIADASFAEQLDINQLLPENDIAKLHTTILSDQTPPITRFELSLPDTHKYTVARRGNNIEINILPIAPYEGQEPSTEAPVAATAKVPSLFDILVETTPKETTVTLVADAPIVGFRPDTVAADDRMPNRMYIDIKNLNIDEVAKDRYIGSALDRIRVAKRNTGARIVFDSGLDELFKYDIATDPRGLVITIQEAQDQGAISSLLDRATVSENESTPPPANTTDATLKELIDSSEATMQDEPVAAVDEEAMADSVTQMQDSFEFAGYKKKRISVDFYKIDIHNVFRLFRQISDINLVVDEAVTGSLTLALNDVPWDFALDIILNLADLKKEERFNTFVIYPKDKGFSWPERTLDNLTFEADVEVVEQEALVIQQSSNQPKEIMKAKEIIRKAQIEENNDDYEDAANLYEQAFKLWPTNATLSNRLATLFLVNLRMNAKAAFYAKESLKHTPDNAKAALYAAIALANMNKTAEATEYFSQSISGTPPMKEALMSYATFSENNNRPEAALTLLNKYSTHYGESVDSMVAKARLLDKLGKTDQATKQYHALLNSGFQLRADLKKYIQGRLAAGNF